MATSSSSEGAYGSRVSQGPSLIPYTKGRCPCFTSEVEHLPTLWTIEPCRDVRRQPRYEFIRRVEDHF